MKRKKYFRKCPNCEKKLGYTTKHRQEYANKHKVICNKCAGIKRRSNMVGKKYNRLIVIKESDRSLTDKIRWLCKCDCGNYTIVQGSNLRSGHVKSCGCLSKESTAIRSTTHGMYGSPTHKAWIGMKARCNNPNIKHFKHYGGRGIKVCKQWNKFESFYKDMGEKPEGLTLERIDTNGNYEPSNCKWATWKEQERNRTNNRLITYRGKTQCLAAWAEEKEIVYSALLWRLDKYSPEIAFNM